MADTKQTTDLPSVVFTCTWCGRPVTLVAAPTGAEIPDVASFLRDHSECLRRAASANRTLEPERDTRDEPRIPEARKP